MPTVFPATETPRKHSQQMDNLHFQKWLAKWQQGSRKPTPKFSFLKLIQILDQQDSNMNQYLN